MLTARVLGPVEVLRGDTPVDLGGAVPRRLLTALVAAGGRTVPDDVLVDAIWGADPPAKPAGALQVYVSRLRAAFGPDGRDQLKRDSTGYRVDMPTDAAEFASTVDQGRRELAEGRPQEALTSLTDALKLWRGEPYAGLGTAEAARTRLHELMQAAQEERAAARLATGDAPGAVADLEELVRAAPLRERRWALLVLSLYRCGRQGDALAAVRRVRTILADELGVDPGTELQDLERQVLAHDPGLRTAPVRRPLTSFRGRDEELKSLTGRLTEHRLVSLIGPAGVGKTRLAVEYGATWFAKLADVSRPAALPSVVADAIGLVAVHDDPVDAVIRALTGRPGVLVLDNCEHVVDAAADLAVALLEGCPQLTILATSREPLGVDGEVTVPLNPLPLNHAVALLVDRVQAVRPGWTLEQDELEDAQRISEALDGLPLAIELAAARARMFGLGEIAARLDDRFALLGPVPKGSVTAHATLEAAIGWSVDLLSTVDRELLLRLWPFEGGFTLQAAQAAGRGSAVATLESLSSLVSRSVVSADTSEIPTRYLLLESVRAYCRSRDPDPAATRLAHARWVRGLADDCVAAMRTRQAGPFLRGLARELPNIRAGVAHDLDLDPHAAMHMLAGFGLFLTRVVHNTEALQWVRAVSAAAPDAPVVDRARVAINLVALNDFAGNFDEARRLVAQIAGSVFTEFTEEHDPLDRGELHYFLGYSAVETRHVGIALDQARKAIDVGMNSGIRWVAGAGRVVHAVARALQALLDDNLGTLAEAAREAHAIARGWTSGWANAVLAEAYLRDPDGPAAEALHAANTAVVVFNDQADIPFAIDAAILGALALARLGRSRDAVRLIAGLHAHSHRLGIKAATFLAPDAGWIDTALAGLLSPAERAGASAEGAALTWAGLMACMADASELYGG